MPLKAEDRVKEILYDLRHSTAPFDLCRVSSDSVCLIDSVTDVAGMAVMDLSASPMVGLNRDQ